MKCQCGEKVHAKGMCRKHYLQHYKERDQTKRRQRSRRYCVELDKHVTKTNRRTKGNENAPWYICPKRLTKPCRLDCELFLWVQPEDIHHLAKKFAPPEEAAEFTAEYREAQRLMQRAVNNYLSVHKRQGRPTVKKEVMPPCYNCYPENVLFCAEKDYECYKFTRYLEGEGRV